MRAISSIAVLMVASSPMALPALALYVVLASQGVRRGWRHPASLAFLLVWLAIALVSLLSGLGDQEPTGHVHTLPAGVRSAMVAMTTALALLGLPAALFGGLRNSTLRARCVAACLGGVFGLILAIVVGFNLSCMADLGCL
jgi:hypothetical protein